MPPSSPRNRAKCRRRAMPGAMAIVCAAAPIARAQTCPGSQWTVRSPPTVPAARSQHAMVFDSTRVRTVLFGGASGATPYNDLWEFDGAPGTWSQRVPTGSSPSVRSGHAMVYDAGRGRVLLFGGSSGVLLNDTWEWDGAAGIWTLRAPVNPPGARRNAAMAYDSVRHKAVLFGGAGPGLLADTWEWDGALGTWTLRTPPSAPAARELHSATFDSARARIIVFGGLISDQRVWEWDGAGAGAWAARTALPAPAGRQGAAMAYDPARARAVLFGGADTGSLDDTWEWDGAHGAWVRRSTSGPIGRARHAMVFDSARAICTLFGGQTTAALGDTWDLPPGALPTITQQPVSRTVSEGGSATFTVAASGTGTLSYQWRRGGLALSNGGAITGAQGPTLTIGPAAPGDAGAYDATVTDACSGATSNPATLTVNTGCAADYDHNGLVQPADVALFVSTWFTSLTQGTLAGDFDGNGAVQPADVAAFIGVWFNSLAGGC